MKVRDVMTPNFRTCGPNANAAELAQVFWERDCGAIPIVDEKDRVIGIVTDRDVCIALGTRDAKPSHLRAGDIMTRDVATVMPGDDLVAAIDLMRERRVRRLPVIGPDGDLEGMISLHDVLAASDEGDLDAIVLGTLRSLCGHGARPAISSGI